MKSANEVRSDQIQDQRGGPGLHVIWQRMEGKTKKKEHKTQQRKIVHTRRQVERVNKFFKSFFFDVIQVVVQEI